MASLCSLRGIRRRFMHHGQPLDVLRGVDLDVEAGQRIGLTGPSGSGKSTLLSIVGMIDDAYEGRLEFEGADVRSRTDAERSQLRLSRLGIVFQDLHLVPSLTAQENVALPSVAAGKSENAAVKDAARLLSAAGLANRLEHVPADLSGGERRRVAVARALINGPSLLLLDEPTSQLDDASRAGVLGLVETAAKGGAAVVAVTHDDGLWESCGRRFLLVAGRLEDAPAAQPSPSDAATGVYKP